INEAQRQILLEGFRRVIQVKGGTAWGKHFNPSWNAAGKTGSAEVVGQEDTNGWFVCFAPFPDPEVCVLVLVEGEGHGATTAAPIAREIMNAYFKEKNSVTLAANN
ncbi:penicillin-binding protein 2, partial [Candidatus Sumerlaeota bacterium]|nr:penicillin-binding protein 2 [Candidatus Sumerlaeota bacterium]